MQKVSKFLHERKDVRVVQAGKKSGVPYKGLVTSKKISQNPFSLNQGKDATASLLGTFLKGA